MPESRILQSWTKLAESLCAIPNVMGVDLYEEPYNSVWGFPDDRASNLNWNKAAERMGNHVLDHCSRWLIMVQGVAS